MRIRAPAPWRCATRSLHRLRAAAWLALGLGAGATLAGLARAEEGGERCAEANADAGAPDARPVATVAVRAPAPAPALPTPAPPSRGGQCRRAGGRLSCGGPSKVPVASGEALERATRLGLGTPRALLVLQRQVPPAAWVEAASAIDAEGGPFPWPVDGGRYLRGYGLVRRRVRRRGQRRVKGAMRLHGGVDIGAAPGTPIRAVRGGLVAYSDNGVRGYGNLVMVVHADATVAWYAHCRAALVAAGELVSRGQAIAEVGQTGLARGPHLHFELRREGRPFDPMPLLEAPEAGGRRLDQPSGGGDQEVPEKAPGA